MGRWWGRVGMFVLTVSAAAVIFTLLAGKILHTATITDYLEYEGISYTLLIRDAMRDMRLNLAGTRCFKPLPAWVEEYGEELSSSYYGQFIQLHDEQPQDAIERLRCR